MRVWRQREASPLPRQPLLAIGLLVPAIALALAFHSAGAAPAGVSETAGSAPAQATVAPGNIKVRGRIFYIDRNSDRNHPAAGLKVEVYDKDERAFGAFELLDTTTTDAQGFFESREVSNVDPDGPAGQLEGTQDIFLKIHTDNGTVRVFETGTNRSYSWTSYQIDERDGLVRNVPDGVVGMPPLYVMENTRDVEALWTFVNLVEGWLYLDAHSATDPGPVTAYWSNTAQDGPRYDPAQRAIFLRDADAGFADVVVQQEAYAFLHNAYGSLPAGWDGCTAGPLEDVKTSTDAACAFAQGFATYFPLAVYESPEFESLAVRALDLDTQDAASPGWSSGDTVSGRVAGALWDLHEADATVERYDRINASFDSVWSALAGRKPSSMRDWWLAWIAAGNDSCGALASLYQNTIDYNTPPTVTGIGEVTMDEDTIKILRLGDYVSDLECPDADLAYELVQPGQSEAGVHLVPTGVISITPEANWFGTTNVRVTVSDGPSTLPIDFRLVVRSVNDCPEIDPPIQSVQERHGLPITLELLGHGLDVEDASALLAWDVDLEPQDEADVAVSGRGSTSLTFQLRGDVIEQRNVRALIKVEDTEGCVTRQPVYLSWAARPNRPPTVWFDRLTREYVALVNTDIQVDLTDVATDDEDSADELEWRVVNQLEHAGWGYTEPDNRQMVYFRPHDDYIGSQVAELRVADTDGAVAPPPPATAGITLTWVSRTDFDNLPPFILKNKLRGKVVGTGAVACYDLRDKADDPNDPVSSLRWFIVNYDARDVTVSGQGTQRLCMAPAAGRQDFEGCLVHEFVVMDPWNAESEPHEVRTCWRTIRNFFPFVTKRGR